MKQVKVIKGGETKPSFTTKNGIGLGRFVRIQVEDKLGEGYLSLAEVEVYSVR